MKLIPSNLSKKKKFIGKKYVMQRWFHQWNEYTMHVYSILKRHLYDFYSGIFTAFVFCVHHSPAYCNHAQNPIPSLRFHEIKNENNSILCGNFTSIDFVENWFYFLSVDDGPQFCCNRTFSKNIQIDRIVIEIELFSIKLTEKVDKLLSSMKKLLSNFYGRWWEFLWVFIAIFMTQSNP